MLRLKEGGPIYSIEVGRFTISKSACLVSVCLSFSAYANNVRNMVPRRPAVTISGNLGLIGSTAANGIKMVVPAGVQNGDLMLAFYSYWAPAAASAPSGWTLLQTVTSSSSAVETVWYRFANNDTPGSTYLWSFGAATPFEAGGMLAYRGLTPSAFLDGSCTSQGTSSAPFVCSFATHSSNDL
jgi:hypothetical protein